MEAAEQLWRAKDVDSVSVSDVCSAAKVSKGSFYFYFPRKEHLLVMLVFARMTPRDSEIHVLLEANLDTTRTCSEIAAVFASRASKLPKPLVQRGVEEAFRHYREIRKLPGADRNMRWYFQPVLARGLERGEVAATWDLETLSTTMGWAVLQGILFWSTNLVSDGDFEANLRQRAELVACGAESKRPVATKLNRKTRALMNILRRSG
jgi:AcrR family transcriptional regulator